MGNINMIMAKHESMINAWRERVMECKTSGLTVAEWCERNHINKKTYFYWQKQVWDHEINTMIPDRLPNRPADLYPLRRLRRGIAGGMPAAVCGSFSSLAV